jgi:hypothetical protein
MALLPDTASTLTENKSSFLVGGSSSDLFRKSFVNHVFSTTEEGKAEVLNVLQYVALAVIPVILLNKIVHRFIPDANTDRSSLELVFEIAIQLTVLFGGMIFIHRFVTYFPTYSGFVYDHLSLTSVILAFLILVLSIQTKLGIKVNILYDRVIHLWNGTSEEDAPQRRRKVSFVPHVPSQADDYDRNPTVPSTAAPPTQSVAPVGTLLGSGPIAANTFSGGFSSFY